MFKGLLLAGGSSCAHALRSGLRFARMICSDTTADLDLAYHYTSAETFKKIVESDSLRMSSWQNTNDPRESKEWHASLTIKYVPDVRPPEAELSVSDHQLGQASEQLNRRLRESARLLCFCTDYEPVVNPSPHFFHRGWARARMWSQYGAQHTGVCFVFVQHELVAQVDEERPHENNDVFAFGRVKYIDAPLTIPVPASAVVAGTLAEYLEDLQVKQWVNNDLYFQKATDWAGEHEYRIAYVPGTGRTDDGPFVKLGDALKGIVVGDAFSDDATLQRLLSGHPSLEVFRCRWIDGARYPEPMALP